MKEHFKKYWWIYAIIVLLIITIVVMRRMKNALPAQPTGTTGNGSVMTCTTSDDSKKIYYGDSNCEVQKIQNAINKSTYSPKLVEDGVYGNKTKTALMSLGATQSMIDTGISYNMIRQLLSSIGITI